jgi:hypothetical protein
MLNPYWLLIPFVLQMLFMAADEFWFHRKRGLPRWERIGHPLDTLTVVLCLGMILGVPPGRRALGVYFALAVFSCIFVTKDEPVHKRCCEAGEHWLHAALFILHPVTLAIAGLLWPAVWSSSPDLFPWIAQNPGFAHTLILCICILMVVFGVYQIVFWNLLWHPRKAVQ